jgi:hypothetical protein
MTRNPGGFPPPLSSEDDGHGFDVREVLAPDNLRASPGQDHGLQLDALKKAGCARVFVETGSGTKRDRPELTKLLDFARDHQGKLKVASAPG